VVVLEEVEVCSSFCSVDSGAGASDLEREGERDALRERELLLERERLPERERLAERELEE